MNHVNFMFLPGSCGDFFVKSLHLINGVSIEGSCMNGFSAQEKFLAHSYSNAKKYKNYKGGPTYKQHNIDKKTSFN